MSEEVKTRNPSGTGEDVSVLGLFGALGAYLASLVQDPNLQSLIVGGTMIIGNTFATWLRNVLGDSISAKVIGTGPPKGSIVKDG